MKFGNILLSLCLFAPMLQAVDAAQVVRNINTFLDIAEFLVKSKHDLSKLKEELQKIPLFVKGCKMLKATDSRYPDIRIGNSKILLKDYSGSPMAKLDESGRPTLDEKGQIIYQKLTVDCNNFKDVFSGVSKSLDYLKEKVLGSSDHPNAVFIKVLEVLGLQDKIPSVNVLSNSIDWMKDFIDNIDKVIKIPSSSVAPSSTSEVSPKKDEIKK